MPLRQTSKPVDSFDIALYPKEPVAADAPRKLVDIPLSFRCICASLAQWARPCGGCKWSTKKR